MPEPPMPPGFAYPPVGVVDLLACLLVVGFACSMWRAVRREITRYKRITWR